ncbi:MAG TPA: flagellar hook-associated protein FlgK [Blastocatellia bacterium]|nr:flagellar hook-associated protein FlgK [Blastocatellia bacterium]
MTVSLASTLSTALSALQASTLGLATANHNISNVNTPGYSRQQINLTENPATTTVNGSVGNGVKVESITAFRDRFIEARLNQETSSQGRYSSLSSGLQQLEGIFNETTGDGLSASMDQFFNAFSALANNPEAASARSVVVDDGKALAQEFNARAGRLQTLQQQTDQSVADTVTSINNLASQIAVLNRKIAGAEVGSDTANDLRDQRGAAITQLSQLVDVSSIEDSTGAVQVTIGGGHTLVAGSKADQLVTGQDANGLTTLNLGGSDITGQITNGQLAGLLTTRDGAIPQAMSSLNDLAALITSKVNAQHEQGTGLDGSTGIDFFTPSPATNGVNGAAWAMAVNPTVINDLNKLAASGSGILTDNTNALALGALATQTFSTSSSTGTFNQLYGTLVSQAGSQSQAAQNNSSIQDAVVQQVQNQRDAVSGVSLDEEAVSIMNYQRLYQSASKVISVIDSLTSDLMNMVQ